MATSIVTEGDTLITMMSFKKEAARLSNLKGTVSDIKDFEFDNPNEDNVSENSSLKDVSGFSFFTLGPVYVGAQVPFSFIEQYAAEVDKHQFILIELPVQFAKTLEVFEDGKQVGDWGDKMHGIQKDKLDTLTDFITSQVLGRASEEKVYGIDYKDMFIPDPVLKYKGKLDDDSLVKVRVFYPYSKRGTIDPILDMTTNDIVFRVIPTEQDKIKYLNAVLSTQVKGT